jgi:predicted lipid-binding transport protein (Tim44 family)
VFGNRLILVALAAVFTPAGALAQLGRPPSFRPPAGGGGGGGRFLPVPIPTSGGDGALTLVLIGGGLALLVWLGWKVGGALAGAADSERRPSPPRRPVALPPLVPDLIRASAEVQDRHAATVRRMRCLGDRNFDPETMSARVLLLFDRAQEAWAARDLSPVEDAFEPALYRQFTRMLSDMRGRGVINRLERLKLGRVELIAADAPGGEVAALVTFQAVSWYEDERTGALVEGSRELRQFQEVWAFRLSGGRWRLARIEPSAGSPLLRATPATASADG